MGAPAGSRQRSRSRGKGSPAPNPKSRTKPKSKTMTSKRTRRSAATSSSSSSLPKTPSSRGNPKPERGAFRSSSSSQAKHVPFSSLTGAWTYMGDNEYITHGYRIQHSFVEAAKSILMIHNETVNVWTHLIGCLVFIMLLVHFLTPGGISPFDGPDSLHSALEPLPTYDFSAASPAFVDSSEAHRLEPLFGHPYIRGGKHCAVMLIPFIFADVTAADEFHLLAKFPTIRILRRRLKQFAQSSTQALAGSASDLEHKIISLKEAVLELQHNISADSLARIAEMNANLKTTVASLVGSSVEAAGHASETVIDAGHSAAHGLVRVGHTLTNRVEEFVESLSSAMGPSSSIDRNDEVPRWPVQVFLVSACLCLGFSATFHLLYCISQEWGAVLSRLDFTGIGLLIAGSCVPLTVYGFACMPWWQRFHLTACTIVCSASVILTFIPFKSKNLHILRAVAFVSAGGYGFIPLTHMMLAAGLDDQFHRWVANQLLAMGLLYVFGAALYALRIPERFSPGKFNVLLGSHNLFHILVVIAAIVHYNTVMTQYQWRIDHPCSMA